MLAGQFLDWGNPFTSGVLNQPVRYVHGQTIRPAQPFKHGADVPHHPREGLAQLRRGSQEETDEDCQRQGPPALFLSVIARLKTGELEVR
jgi:hypothetical protein